MALPTVNNSKDEPKESGTTASAIGIGKSILSGISKVFTKNTSLTNNTLLEIKNILQLQYEEQLAFRAQQAAAAEEARREALNKLKPEKDKKTKEQGSAFGEIGTGGILGITAIAAVIASITGLDDVIRTIQLPETMKRLTKGFKGIGSAIGDVAVIITKYTKDFTKIATDFTKNLGRVVFNSKPFTDFAERMKKIFTFIGNASNSLKAIAINNLPNLLKPFTEFFKSMGNVFKTVGVESFQNAKNAFPSITNFFKNMFSFVDTAKMAVGGFALQAFESSKIGFTAFSGFLKSTLDFFSSVYENVSKFSVTAFQGAKSAVTGFVSFVQPVVNFFKTTFASMEPFIKPIMAVAKVGLRMNPYFGPILAFIDFITGFIKGFAEAEGGMLVKTMAGIREGIFEIFRGFVTFPLDLIKNGLSWVFGKMGFEGGVDALDSFSFTDVFNKLVKGDFDFMGKITKFFSDIANGIMGIFDMLPSIEDIALSIISTLPSLIQGTALKAAQAAGIVGETGAKKLQASEMQSQMQETDAAIERIESKENLRKRDKDQLRDLKARREKEEKELNALRDQVKESELVNDKRSSEQVEEDRKDAANRLDEIDKRMKERFEAFRTGNYKFEDADGKELSGKELEDAFLMKQKEDQEKRIAAERDFMKTRNIQKARINRSEQQEKEAMRAKIEDELIDTLGDGNTAIGEAKYRRLTQEQKDALIRSKMGDAEDALGKAVIGGQATGYAIDAGSRAAAEAANQNQQINVVAPQTDASVTNQTTNNYASPGPAQAVNPDSTFRRGLFVQDI